MLTTMLFAFGAGRLSAMEKSLILMVVIFFLVTGAVGIHEAWSKRRGVLGWLVSVIASVVGGTVGGLALGGGAGAAASVLQKQVLPDWHGLDAAVSLIAILIGLYFGARIALRLVNRWR